MKKIVALMICLQANFCFGQNFTFFKDLNETKTDPFRSITNSINYKGELYFFMTTQTYGCELWKTDGTVEGTRLVKDIIPGVINENVNGAFVTIFNNQLYFMYQTPDKGLELWQTDGTAAGTQLFFESYKGIYSGFGAMQFVTTALPTPAMYFCVRDSVYTYSLYKYTPGKPAARRFYSYTVNTTSSSDLTITSLYALGSKLLFFRYEAGSYSGMEPWVSDGTKRGTHILKNINTQTGNYTGSQNSSSGQQSFFIGDINGYAFFSAKDTAHGYELWKTDGTIQGTTLLKDIAPDIQGAMLNGTNTGIKLANGNILFGAITPANSYEPWVTDGTPAGTQLVKDIAPGTYPSNMSTTNYGTFNNKTIILATDSLLGQNPYVSNGTDTGTYLLQDIFPLSNKTMNALTFTPGPLLNGAAFYGRDSLYNCYLFITDGNAGNVDTVATYTPKTINGGIYYPNIGSIGNVNNKLLYRVIYSLSGNNFSEYYITDGTAPGTQPVDFSQIVKENASSYASGFTKFNGEWFFAANNGIDGVQMWKTDGTVGGTYMFKNLAKSSLGVGSVSPSSQFNELNGSLYFTSAGKLIKYTGGSSANFSLGEPASTDLLYDPVYKTGQQFFFGRSIPVKGNEPWHFNGTISTMMEINTTNNCSPSNIGYCSSNPNVIKILPGSIIFSAKEDNGMPNLYRYTGGSYWTKISTTYQTLDILLADTGKYFYWWRNSVFSSDIHYNYNSHVTISGMFDSVAHPVAYDNTYFYFAAKSGNSGYQLWKTDGTVSNTALLKVINPSGNAFEIAPTSNTYKTAGSFLNGNFYFFANDGVNGYELWKSDGTTAGTFMLKNIRASGSSKKDFHDMRWSADEVFIRCNNKLYFIADDGVHGYEVWETDGSVAGTQLTTDINPSGSAFQIDPSQATVGYYRLPFTANDTVCIFNAYNGNALEAYCIDKATSSIKLFDINKGYPDYYGKPHFMFNMLSQYLTAPELNLMTAYCPAKGYELYKYSVTPPPNPNLVCAVNSGCTGDSLTITYALNSRINAGNIITLQMSDALGSFTQPVTISTFTLSSGSQTFAIPASVTPGSNYRFRLTTSNPAAVLPDNGTDVVIASAPQITNCTDSIFAYAQPGLCGAYVNYNFTAVATPQGESDYSKAPNSFFATGNTAVYFTAWNGCGYDTCYFTVVVRDTLSPVLTCPADITTATPVVTYNATATDNCSTPVVTFNPPSGTSFPLGTTMVTATATDSSGNTSLCQFAVNITVMRMAGTNTEKGAQEQQFEVSPVPAKGFLNIVFNASSNQDIHIKLKNVTGVVFYEHNTAAIKGNNSYTFKTGHLSGGVYVVEITGDNIHAMQKVLLQE